MNTSKKTVRSFTPVTSSRSQSTAASLSPDTARSITRDSLISIGLYATPIVLLFATCWITGQRPWLHGPAKPVLTFLGPVLTNLSSWGLPAITLAVGLSEFLFGLYDRRWTKNEKILDAVCFVGSKVLIRPAVVYFTLRALPWLLPDQKGVFAWVPFWWGFFIIAVADDLTQYWYHRLHHQVPWLWRFHRTHHSAPYMGMSMASRQNIIYTVFFSQIYLTAALTYLGLGEAALLVTAIKSLITLAAHSSIAWDKPFYRYRVLRPLAWVLERLISTPATHHAHHADSNDDGIGHYKGNFGNMFFLWDVIFGTGIITRKYPSGYGIKHYQQEEWYAQFLWPLFKSRKTGSELSRGGPIVGDAVIVPTLAHDAVLTPTHAHDAVLTPSHAHDAVLTPSHAHDALTPPSHTHLAKNNFQLLSTENEEENFSGNVAGHSTVLS